MSKPSRSKCMDCPKPPTHEARWAEGRARAWFCETHWDKWSKKRENDIMAKREVKGGEVGKKYGEDPNQGSSVSAARVALRKINDKTDIDFAGSFMKTSPVKAVQMDEPFEVKTLEGTVTGKAGDYLCEGVEGERWPIDKDIFEKTYQPKTAAEMGTDTATIFAISPEALYDLINEEEWREWADAMWGDSPRDIPAMGGNDPWQMMELLVRQHGGAVFHTGADGLWDVTVEGSRNEAGFLPPYNTPAYKDGNSNSVGMTSQNRAAGSVQPAPEWIRRLFTTKDPDFTDTLTTGEPINVYRVTRQDCMARRTAARHLMAQRLTFRHQGRVVVARMKQAGWWSIKDNEDKYVGDGPLDMVGDFSQKIDLVYRQVWGRPAYPQELQALGDALVPGPLWPLNQWVDLVAKHTGMSPKAIASLCPSCVRDRTRAAVGQPLTGWQPDPVEAAHRTERGDHMARKAATGKHLSPQERVASRHTARQDKTAAETSHVGLFIPIPEPLASEFPGLGDEDSSPPHVTLLYVGDVPADRQDTFLGICGAVLAREPGPIRAWTNGVDHFTHPDKNRQVFYVPIRFSRDVAEIRDRLWVKLEEAGFEVANSFPLAYNPHTTLAYAEGLNNTWNGPVPDGAWEFSSVQVWGLSKDYEVLLGSFKQHDRTLLERQQLGLLNAWGDFLDE